MLLVVAELLTNAIDHTGGPLTMELWLATRDERLRIDVTRTSPAAPRILPARPGEPHHRGLRIVDHIARAWGHHLNHVHKSVWVELSLPRSSI
ncbi:ATP-binding protein [Kitasatospora sp. NPDC085895]|uniref:ATP-binding protein n=1 Tax=Kitasatospora sp. NPDC085895 TaxID=3155057 RepID=UPI00344F84A2